jgi:hypothetical protein
VPILSLFSLISLTPHDFAVKEKREQQKMRAMKQLQRRHVGLRTMILN